MAGLATDMRAAVDGAPVGSRWLHRKGGEYVVVGHCLLEATVTPAILYSHDDPGSPFWARAASEFLDGRFTRIKEA